ncbi:MAG: hypothetical protein DI630_31040 [Gordonia sp. (in: high G+C Gram-positive bacteria)]|nr:MAG: hypothetical protein DI630_31040 [Gordonia sp. (in: high G+C Gram-positive bacteria)]
MSGQHVTIASLVGEYALYGVTIGMIRSHAASIAVNNAAHLDGDHDPLPADVARQLVVELDVLAADFQSQIPARQAAYEDEVRRNGRIVA